MPREGDERAVTVVIGAVLMFGILVTSLAMYQANVVPDQNQGTEWDHHQEVTADLLDLRNAVVNAGYENSTRETTVALGTQYESRTFSINPPDPQGTIRTNSTGDPQVKVIRDGKQNLSFDTSFIEYEPGYNEYDAPTTVIEHGLVYDEHGHVNITRDAGSVISDERIVIPLVEGNLSESSRSTASVTVETIDVYHVSSEVSEIRLPTNAFEAWNESYDNVSESDGSAVYTPESGQDVYIAQIAVGDDREKDQATSDDLDEFGEQYQSQGSAGGPYDVFWSEEQSDSDVMSCDDAGCDEDYRVKLDASSVTFYAESDASGSDADFSYDDRDDVGVSIVTENGFDENGDGSVEMDGFDREGVFELYVSSGGITDAISVLVESHEGPSFDSVTVTDDSRDNSQGNDGSVEYTVGYNISDPNGEMEWVKIEFKNIDQSFTANDSSTDLTGEFIHDPSKKEADYEDEYRMELVVVDSSGNVTDQFIVEDVADGSDP